MMDRYLELVARQLPITVWATDGDLRVIRAHGRVVRDLEAAGAQIVGAKIGDIVGAIGDVDGAIRHHRSALAGEPQAYRTKFFERWWEVRVEPLRDPHGIIEGVVGCAIDVTAQADQAEQDWRQQHEGATHEGATHDNERAALRDIRKKLERSVASLEATLDATVDGILVINQNGRVSANNERFVSLWRVPHRILELRDDAALLAFVSEQLDDPEMFLEGGRELYGRPWAESFDVLRFKDGRVYERGSRPLRVGDAIEGRVWTFHDVTERERLLRRAEFLASTGRLLASLDVESALAAVVEITVPYLGDACAVDLRTNIDDSSEPSPRRLIALAREGAEPIGEHMPREVKDGHRFLECSASTSTMSVPLLVQSGVVGAITCSAARSYTNEEVEVLQSLAERASLAIANAWLYRSAREALTARDDFLSVAAHELRGPVTSIHLAAQTLRKGKVSTQVSPKLLDVIEREDRRLEGLVNELLDVTRIRGGALHLTLQNVELAEVVREVVSRLSFEAGRAGSRLVFESSGSSFGVWDRLRLDQVVTNLVSNAIKFGRAKPVTISVQARDSWTVLTVRDQGIGITLEQQAKLFRPFERAVSSRNYGGLGLGLYIVRTIVEGLGGKVILESKLGEGTTVTVELPRQKEDSWAMTATC